MADIESIEDKVAKMEHVSFERVGENGAIAILALNRPHVRNAITMQMLREVNQVIEIMETTEEIRVAMLTSGTSKHFCSGADLEELMNDSASFAHAILNTRNIIDMKKPSIAVVKGAAIGGGCEIALMCDIIYAGTSARFAFPEVSHKTIPGGGGTQRTTAAVGKSRAMEMILSGDRISAHDAEKWGLVSRVFDDDVVMDEALKLAARIAAHSPMAVMKAKQAIKGFVEHSLQAIPLEQELFVSTFEKGNRNDVIASYNEKRKLQQQLSEGGENV